MVAQSPDRKWRRRRRLLALTLIAAVTLTMEIAPRHPAHGLAGKGSESEPAFEVLSSDLWRILDRVRTSWRGGGPFRRPAAENLEMDREMIRKTGRLAEAYFWEPPLMNGW